jgi:hypothetical protein
LLLPALLLLTVLLLLLLLVTCLQAIVDSHPDPPGSGHDGGMGVEMGDGDDEDYAAAAGEALTR